MANLTQKIQTTVSNSNGATSISGYDTESGNASVGPLSQNFPANAANSQVSLAFTLANLQSIVLLSDKGCTIRTNGTGTADVQTISISGTPTGGTFPLVFNGQVAAGLPYDATAAQVQSALQGLSSIGSGNVTCTGGPLPGTAIVCTFAGTLATGQQPLLLTGSGGLTGGTSPAASVAHTTPGLPTQTITLEPGIPVVWGASMGTQCPFTSSVTTAYVSNAPSQNLQISGLTL
jgi:hypothetical protein